MPYIPQARRDELDQAPIRAKTPGELNYVITDQCLNYIFLHGGVQYSTLNEVIGALECAKQELYRRVLAPYEDQKREENGDVYQ